MTDQNYLRGRQKYGRPQAMLWANNPGYVDEDGFILPYGEEVSSKLYDPTDNKFLVLSDDNRKDISFRTERIEKRQRMINGRMRSYHTADKLSIETSWEMLPSRAYPDSAQFDEFTGKVQQALVGKEYTTDGGAGGAEILDWYKATKGSSFFVYLAYDNYPNFGKESVDFQNLNKYNEVIEVFFADFTYSVVKRGQSTYDFWNINLSMEEV